jgi:hypothetical protein
MPHSPKVDQTEKKEEVSTRSKMPLIFVSHDSQDAELAEAFNKLVSSVSMGVLKVFRSSDTKGTQGIEYGTEWYPTIMKKLETASDFVCLLTERSIDRPWILYEAGVAVGKLNTRICGIALGIPLTRLNTGPFAQFQNCDDSEESLTKLVMQLAKRVPDSEPDQDAILMQVKLFKQNTEKCLEKIANRKKEKDLPKPENVPIPKLFEEIKVMFQDLSSRTEINSERSLKMRRFSPELLMDFAEYLSRGREDPAAILVISSIFRNDLPWLYESGMEVYRAVKSGNYRKVTIAFHDFEKLASLTMRGPFVDSSAISRINIEHMHDILQSFIRRHSIEQEIIKEDDSHPK